MIAVEAVDVVKRFRSVDGSELTVLNGVDLQVDRGEMVAVVGASGAGKSTLLQILGALDPPTSGLVMIGGVRLDAPSRSPTPGQPDRGPSAFARFGRLMMDGARRRHEFRRDEELSHLRNRSIGFVFQFHHLLREFSALENVMMPLLLAQWDRERARARADELLGRIGLENRRHHRPAELSGGEQQRTAVARALAGGPAVLLADEPSGNLDHANSERLHDLFVDVARDFNVAMVIATHNRLLANRADRVLSLEDGKLQDANVREVVP
ncbi:MAG TPA: ABC transporter ATP-binding protein [Gemmatimonadaceae bacterium]|nr:ABC transporter ATP-binding protein [Gemmatimonadaceae bacterium]